MSGESAFQVEGIVSEALPNGTYRVKLLNGHEIVAFMTGKEKHGSIKFGPGTKVNLQLSPYDLSEGRIIVEKKTI